MPAGTWDLRIDQGATFTQTFTTTGTDWTGWTPRAQIRADRRPGADLLLDLTTHLTVDGQAITLAIPADQTATLTRSGQWDLELEDGDGTVIRLLEGKALVSLEVTQ